MKYRLKEHRQSHGWTIDYVAGVTGLSRGFLSQLENGRREPGPETLELLAEAYQVKVADLYSEQIMSSLTDEEETLLAWFRTVPESERHLVRRLLQAAAEQAPADPEATPAPPDAGDEPRK